MKPLSRYNHVPVSRIRVSHPVVAGSRRSAIVNLGSMDETYEWGAQNINDQSHKKVFTEYDYLEDPFLYTGTKNSIHFIASRISVASLR